MATTPGEQAKNPPTYKGLLGWGIGTAVVASVGVIALLTYGAAADEPVAIPGANLVVAVGATVGALLIVASVILRELAAVKAGVGLLAASVANLVEHQAPARAEYVDDPHQRDLGQQLSEMRDQQHAILMRLAEVLGDNVIGLDTVRGLAAISRQRHEP